MTWMPLVTLIRNLIADGEWHRFEEIADAIVGPADDLHMILFRMRDLGEIDILKAGGWSLKIRLRDPSAKPIRGQPPWFENWQRPVRERRVRTVRARRHAVGPAGRSAGERHRQWRLARSVRPAASRNWPPAARPPRWFAFKTTSTAVPRRVIPVLAQDLADRNRLARDDAVVAGVAGRHIDDGAGGD
jgi:hypothetical protein